MQNKYLESYEILKNSYENFFEGENNKPSFTFFEGNKKVIFSCPHAVNQTRKGKTKLADVNTGPLGLALNNLGYPVLIKTNNCNDDANFDLISDYKIFLAKTIKQNNYKFCIDLHGLSAKRDVLIDLGTNFGKNENKNLQNTNLFLKVANKNGLPAHLMRIDFPFHAPITTVSSYIHNHCKIATLQLEINSKIFESKEQTIALLKTLDDYANYLEKYLEYFTKDISYKQFLELDDKFFNQKFENNKIYSSQKEKSNILISSPHSSNMIHENVASYQETQSGALAIQLSNAQKINYFCKTKNTEYYSNPEYIEKISEFINNKKIKYLIELHIMNKSRIEDITLVINKGASINYNFDLIINILKILNQNNFTNISIDYPFNSENFESTVAQINKKTQAFAFQFIINERLVRNKKLFKQLTLALQQIIIDLKIYDEFLTI